MSLFKAATLSPFAARPAEEKLPHRKVKALERRKAMLSEAAAILAHLPGPGQALHCLMTGRYDLMHLLLVVLDAYPQAVTHLRIATLSYNALNLAELLALLDSGKVQKLFFLCSRFFQEHTPEIYLRTFQELTARGQRLAAARTHAKVICITWEGGENMVLEGSANLRSNSNQEQLALIRDPDLLSWHAAWIDGMIAKYEGDASSNSATD